MAQVQLATKITIETHYKLDRLSKDLKRSKASIVEDAIINYYDQNQNQDQEKKTISRGKDGRFQKNK